MKRRIRVRRHKRGRDGSCVKDVCVDSYLRSLPKKKRTKTHKGACHGK